MSPICEGPPFGHRDAMPATTAAPALDVDTLVDATPDSRDRVVDLVRALSIAVVVLWHWVFSVTHVDGGALTMPNPIGDVPLLWLATWLLQVMPVFFVVGGFANLASYDAARRQAGTAGGGDRSFVGRRLQRLLRPTAVFVAAWVVLEIAAGMLIDDYPGVLHWGEVVFVPLWFLGTYLAVSLLTPITARLHRLAPEATLVALGTAIALCDLARFRFDVAPAGLAGSALVWVFAHQLGYLWRDGTLTAWPRRRLSALALAGLGALVVLTNTGVYERSMVAVSGEATSNMFPTTACIAALAVFQLAVVLLLRPVATRWVSRRAVWRLVVSANAVAMTVFTWHMTALAVVIGAWLAVGLELSSEPTLGWWLTRPLWLGGPAVVLTGLVRATARFEIAR